MNTPMTDAQKAILEDLKARQQGGEHLPCPRCGRDTMDEPWKHNALSRQADIMVCCECGLSEAFESMARQHKPLAEWACFSAEHQ